MKTLRFLSLMATVIVSYGQYGGYDQEPHHRVAQKVHCTFDSTVQCTKNQEVRFGSGEDETKCEGSSGSIDCTHYFLDYEDKISVFGWNNQQAGDFGSIDLDGYPIWESSNQLSNNNQQATQSSVVQIVQCKFGPIFECRNREEVRFLGGSTQTKCYKGLGRLGYATYPIIECTHVKSDPTQFTQQGQYPPIQQNPYLQNPQNPSLSNPQNPYLQNPQNPYLSNPQNPYLQNPQNPSLSNPQNPYLQNPQNPYLSNPQNPYIQNPQNPSLQNPQNPYIQNPQNPYLQNPQNPYLQNPQNPYLQNPPQDQYSPSARGNYSPTQQGFF